MWKYQFQNGGSTLYQVQQKSSTKGRSFLHWVKVNQEVNHGMNSSLWLADRQVNLVANFNQAQKRPALRACLQLFRNGLAFYVKFDIFNCSSKWNVILFFKESWLFLWTVTVTEIAVLWKICETESHFTWQQINAYNFASKLTSIWWENGETNYGVIFLLHRAHIYTLYTS